MRDPLLRSLFCKKSANSSVEDSSHDSWLNRVRENLAQLLLPSPLKPSAANGAPIHLLQFEKSARPAGAQGASLLAHAAVLIAVILFLAKGPRIFRDPGPIIRPGDSSITISAATIRTVAGPHPSDGRGNGGDLNPLPPTAGTPPVRSAIQIVKPTSPANQNSILPEPPTILDPNAPAILNSGRIGLDWKSDQNNSAGPGSGHGIGTGPGGGAGTRDPGQYGSGSDNTFYGPGFIPPQCVYCPFPTYSDDARKAKVQGAVTLRVLIGADGRAQDVRIVKGIGFGLDERAIETVRNWKFIAARDSGKRSVSSWVTVEAVFRLF